MTARARQDEGRRGDGSKCAPLSPARRGSCAKEQERGAGSGAKMGPTCQSNGRRQLRAMILPLSSAVPSSPIGRRDGESRDSK